MTEYIEREKLPEYWVAVCKQCTHSYTTKDEPDRIKCRCKKKCHFEDIKLKGDKK